MIPTSKNVFLNKSTLLFKIYFLVFIGKIDHLSIYALESRLKDFLYSVAAFLSVYSYTWVDFLVGVNNKIY